MQEKTPSAHRFISIAFALAVVVFVALIFIRVIQGNVFVHPTDGVDPSAINSPDAVSE